MPAEPRLTALLKQQTPFDDSTMFALRSVTSSCSDADLSSSDSIAEEQVPATAVAVSVEESRAAKRARTEGAEFLSRDSLWNFLRPVVMPDATGELPNIHACDQRLA